MAIRLSADEEMSHGDRAEKQRSPAAAGLMLSPFSFFIFCQRINNDMK
jgi:hypothetical protein